jgi:hypothetical protein
VTSLKRFVPIYADHELHALMAGCTRRVDLPLLETGQEINAGRRTQFQFMGIGALFLPSRATASGSSEPHVGLQRNLKEAVGLPFRPQKSAALSTIVEEISHESG